MKVAYTAFHFERKKWLDCTNGFKGILDLTYVVKNDAVKLKLKDVGAIGPNSVYLLDLTFTIFSTNFPVLA